MVLTKSELIASLQNEVRILRHLAGKVDRERLDYFTVHLAGAQVCSRRSRRRFAVALPARWPNAVIRD